MWMRQVIILGSREDETRGAMRMRSVKPVRTKPVRKTSPCLVQERVCPNWREQVSSVTRWLDYLFNIWSLPTLQVCPTALKLPNRFNFLNNSHLIHSQNFAKGQSSEISPNLVTLKAGPVKNCEDSSKHIFTKLHNFSLIFSRKLLLTLSWKQTILQ